MPGTFRPYLTEGWVFNFKKSLETNRFILSLQCGAFAGGISGRQSENCFSVLTSKVFRLKSIPPLCETRSPLLAAARRTRGLDPTRRAWPCRAASGVNGKPRYAPRGRTVSLRGLLNPSEQFYFIITAHAHALRSVHT